MWGKDLPDIGSKIPSSIQRLMNKSKQLSRLNLNEVNIKKEDDKTTLNVINRVAKIERYATMAENQGYKKIMNSLMRKLKQIANKDVEL